MHLAVHQFEFLHGFWLIFLQSGQGGQNPLNRDFLFIKLLLHNLLLQLIIRVLYQFFALILIIIEPRPIDTLLYKIQSSCGSVEWPVLGQALAVNEIKVLLNGAREWLDGIVILICQIELILGVLTLPEHTCLVKKLLKRSHRVNFKHARYPDNFQITEVLDRNSVHPIWIFDKRDADWRNCLMFFLKVEIMNQVGVPFELVQLLPFNEPGYLLDLVVYPASIPLTFHNLLVIFLVVVDLLNL